MNIILCPNNHHYDADEYDVCPHCPQGETSHENRVEKVRKTTEMPREESKHFPDFSKNNKPQKRKSLFGYLFSSSDDQEETLSKEVEEEKKLLPDIGFKLEDEKPKKGSGTEGYFDWKPEPDDGKSAGGKSLFFDGENAKKQTHNDVTKDFFDDKKAPEKEVFEDVYSDSKKNSDVAEKEVKQTLEENIKQVTGRTEGKTLGYFEKVKNDKTENKVSVQQSQEVHSEPVVGWLVCVKGPHFGESFQIAAGQNSIGRSKNNKIVIYGDPTVSREKHAQLIYDPKGRKFFIKAGDSSGLAYLNGECFFDVRELSEKDNICLGKSEFIFVPLCGDSFEWESYIDKE